MIKEAYCSFEVAKLLKEKGFNEQCKYFYECDGSLNSYRCTTQSNAQLGNKSYSSPTHQMALAWIREKYNLHIKTCIFRESSNDADGNTCEEWSYWSFSVVNTFDGQFVYQDYYHVNCTEYESHEEAVEAALKYVLLNPLLNPQDNDNSDAC